MLKLDVSCSLYIAEEQIWKICLFFCLFVCFYFEGKVEAAVAFKRGDPAAKADKVRRTCRIVKK